MRANTGISEGRACVRLRLSRTALRYRAAGDRRHGWLREAIKSLSAQRRRFRYCRIDALIRRDGEAVNGKCAPRIYQEKGSQIARRRRRRGVAVERSALELPLAPNHVWAMDFVSVSLKYGRRLHCLTIVADDTKETIDIPGDHGISGDYVMRVVIGSAHSPICRGCCEPIRVPSSSENRSIDGPTAAVRRCV
jgi:putative transposase